MKVRYKITPEEAVKLLPIMQAYSQGKTIQKFVASKNEWFDMKELVFNGDPDRYYRIKPDMKEAIQDLKNRYKIELLKTNQILPKELSITLINKRNMLEQFIKELNKIV